MTDLSHPRPGFGQWLLLAVLAGWLAAVPLAVVSALSALADSPPNLLVQAGLVTPGNPLLPEWAFGLLATAITLGLDLLLFVPLYLATRRPGREFLHMTTTLLVALVLFQGLNALAALPWLEDGVATFIVHPAYTAALRLALVLPFLLLGLGSMESRRQGGSLLKAWRRAGLRLWLNPAALWLALGAGAAIVWPWVLVGSLGSPGTTAANALQALSNALHEEILFRGFAFAWLWRAAWGRREAALGSLLLFIAAQGGTVLPTGDWGALLRFFAALLLGLLATELTVRAGGSIWPAVVIHFLYDWFHFAFVDPRSQEEILHWVVQAWAPLAAGGLGLLLWGGRKAARAMQGSRAPRKSRGGAIIAGAFATVAWTFVLILYLTLGVPGFEPDGFLIFLDEQADLRPAAAIADPVERRAWVYRTLAETAERSQAPLRAELDRRGVAYRPHYLVNMIEVQGRPGLRRAFAREQGVASVLFQPGVRRYPHSFQLPAVDPSGPRGVEWNVHEVGADRVWGLGYTGQGVIVGNADTGVAWDHPALKAAYLGWDGNTADHNYHWYDPWDGRAEPWDDNGHGTHTTGIMVGLDGENKVGLAPGARWIACRNMRQGIGNPGAYVSCMEFLLAPFAIGGDPFHDGDPAQGAHVVNNSWGCPKKEGCLPDTLRFAVDNLRAAGQMMVASAGNDGPACSTVQDPPAIYDAVLSVGAIAQGDRAAAFSSRGPVTVDASFLAKPNLVAPGVDVRSSVPLGYASLPGTSMAGPHVAGAVALLWSIDPALAGDVDRTEAILVETAQPLTVDAVCSGQSRSGVVCACGGDTAGAVPNNVYGWGQVDVWAAAQKLLRP
jgi:subtilisin family serine protease